MEWTGNRWVWGRVGQRRQPRWRERSPTSMVVLGSLGDSKAPRWWTGRPSGRRPGRRGHAGTWWSAGAWENPDPCLDRTPFLRCCCQPAGRTGWRVKRIGAAVPVADERWREANRKQGNQAAPDSAGTRRPTSSDHKADRTASSQAARIRIPVRRLVPSGRRGIGNRDADRRTWKIRLRRWVRSATVRRAFPSTPRSEARPSARRSIERRRTPAGIGRSTEPLARTVEPWIRPFKGRDEILEECRSA